MNKKVRRIHSRAPVRICDIGGWTDTWFAGYGSVFNIAVAPCVEVLIKTYPQDSDKRLTLHLKNYNDRYSFDPDAIVYDRHPLIEAAIDSMVIPKDISLDIEIFSKIPAGASMGTSAAVCVALLSALDALTPGRLTAHELAALSHYVETEKLSLQCGIQDQICSAFGGINYIRISPFPKFEVASIRTSECFKSELENRLMVVFIGLPHISSDVHKKVIADLGERAEEDPRIEKLRQLAGEARDAVSSEDLDVLGQVMNRNTDVQRQLHPDLVCDKFNELIQIAEFFDAAGCKVNGAGGDGGSVTILGNGDPVFKKKMLHTLESKDFLTIPVTLSTAGVQVWEE